MPGPRANGILTAVALVGLGIAVLSGCDFQARPQYPARITSPEVLGLVEAITTDPDLTAHVVFVGGEELVVRPGDRSLGGFGDLLFFGNQPERWYLGGHLKEDGTCYWLTASKAYSEPAAVVLVFEQWPGTGLRLPKAPGYDDSKLVTKDSEGRLEYSGIGPISLCSDAEGRVSGF